MIFSKQNVQKMLHDLRRWSLDDKHGPLLKNSPHYNNVVALIENFPILSTFVVPKGLFSRIDYLHARLSLLSKWSATFSFIGLCVFFSNIWQYGFTFRDEIVYVGEPVPIIPVTHYNFAMHGLLCWVPSFLIFSFCYFSLMRLVDGVETLHVSVQRNVLEAQQQIQGCKPLILLPDVQKKHPQSGLPRIGQFALR